MAWTNPRTWVALETPTVAQLNTHLRDNMLETAPAKVTTAGDIVYASAANALARLGIGAEGKALVVASGLPAWGNESSIAYKTADEPVTSSTTLQDDDHLVVPVLANGVYLIEGLIIAQGATAGDIKLGFTYPASPLSNYWSMRKFHNPAQVTGEGAAGSEQADVAVTPSPVVLLTIIFRNGVNAGNWKVQWAQNASNGTATIVKAGSYLKYRKVA